jgi:hypothetical protein
MLALVVVLIAVAAGATGCELLPWRYVHYYHAGDTVAFANGFQLSVPGRWSGSIDMTPEQQGDTTDPAYGMLELQGPSGERLDVGAESAHEASVTLSLWRGWVKKDRSGSSVTTMVAGRNVDAVVFPGGIGPHEQTLEMVVWGGSQPLALQLTDSPQLDNAVTSGRPVGSIATDVLNQLGLRRSPR